MQLEKIQAVHDPIVYLPGLRTFGAIGDPGCEGLGTYNMKVYAGALEESAKDDITLILGDMVPAGNDRYYETFNALTEELAGNRVYVLRGNHDTGAYTAHYGKHNYAILSDDFAVIVLDNAMRTFEAEGLELAARVLARDDVQQAVITFHIPLPNHFIPNSVSSAEFDRLKAAYAPWKDKVKYLLCGHVHSRFVDTVDGIPMICTGGGGAMIEDVSAEIRAGDVNHHMVHFYLEDGRLTYAFTDLPEDCYRTEQKDPILRERLEETVKGELMAHLKYLMFADRARRRGLDAAANLFQALADSEYFHARNFYSVLERPAVFKDAASRFIPGEQFEFEKLYPMMTAYADENKRPLTAQAYTGAAAAEKIHAKLLAEAEEIEQFSRERIYVCPICGYVMTEDKLPERCPVCGGPKRQYQVYDCRA